MSSTDPQQPAPQQPDTPPQYQPAPQQPRYLPPLPHSPGHQPHPPQQQASFGAPDPRPAPHQPARSNGGVNVLGIIALALLVVQTVFGAFTPYFYRMAVENFTAVTTGITVVNVLILLAVLGLAIGGVLQRGADRFRWAAIGSLVAGGLGVAGMILNLFSGWALSMLPW